MQISFNGTLIAQEPSDGGTDAVSGFVPKGTQNVQWIEPLRATDATPVARGNRKQTVTGTIWLQPSDNLGDAMIIRGLTFTQLPRTGVLIFTVQGQVLTYQYAVLAGYETVKNAVGVACGFQLTFNVGPGTQSDLPLLNENGTPLLNENGSQLLS